MERNKTTSRRFRLAGLVFVGALLNASPAFALQRHGYPGIYVHQLAHVFLIFSMASFAFRIRASRLITRRSWRLIAWGAWLVVVWSAWAFAGHFLEILIPQDSIILPPTQRTPLVVVHSWKEIAFYILKMDNLLLIPALVLFYLGLRDILADFVASGEKAQGEGR